MVEMARRQPECHWHLFEAWQFFWEPLGTRMSSPAWAFQKGPGKNSQSSIFR